MFNITMKQLDAYLASQCISLDTVKPIRKAIKGYIADKDSVSEAIEKAIGAFIGTVKIRLISDILLKAIDKLAKAVVEQPCKQADLDLIQGNINLLQERFDDAKKGIVVVKVNKMADDSRKALEKAIAK